MDLPALENFIEPLQHLISSIGGCMGDDVLPNSKNDLQTGFTNLPYPDGLLRLINSVKVLRKHLRVVEDLRRALDERVAALQKECLPFLLEDGIKRLPNEILAHIFEIGHRSSEGFSFSIRVSHVSQRFRNVALSSPALWARFSTLQRNDQVCTFMSRSHQQDIEVTCKSIASGDDIYFKKFFNILLPHSMRWTYLHIDHKLLRFIRSNLPMNRIHTLSLNHVNDTFNDGLCPIPPPFPNLHAFGGFNVIPMFTAYPSNLTTCVLSWYGMRLRVIPLLKCLAHLVSVRTLELTIVDGDPSDLPQDSPTLTHTILCSMPNVTTFVIFGGDVKWHIVRGIFSFLVLPKLYQARISFLRVRTVHGVPGMLRGLVGLSNRPFQNVHTFRVAVVESDNISGWGEDILSLLLEPLPSVRDLTIYIPSGEFVGSYVEWSDEDGEIISTEKPKNQFSLLETLRLIDCRSLSEPKLMALARNLWTNTPGSGLQLLEIISCKEISEEFLLELSSIMGDSLKWRFSTWKKHRNSGGGGGVYGPL